MSRGIEIYSTEDIIRSTLAEFAANVCNPKVKKLQNHHKNTVSSLSKQHLDDGVGDGDQAMGLTMMSKKASSSFMDRRGERCSGMYE